jgi:hypothetical protein
VNGLEQQLRALGHELAYPPEPDLAPAVLARLDRKPFPWLRAAAVALAVVAIAIATAFAVPQARSAILRFFHLRGVTVERVETLPRAVERPRAGGLGRKVSLAEAERRVGFRLALPPFKGAPPRRAFVVGDSLATVVLHAYGTRVLLSEFRAASGSNVKKLAFDDTRVEPARVKGWPGLWISGHPHTFAYYDRDGSYRQRPVLVRGNVLLWVRGALTLRLEGRLTKAQALALARLIE